MKLSKLMQGKTPNLGFSGAVVNDNWVLAVGIEKDALIDDYIVAQEGIAGLDPQMNPVEQTKTYVRAGQTSTKTATQRTFKITGDRFVGDEFQDYCFSHAIKYGVGQEVVVPYVFFSLLTGKGERGTVSIIVNTDGGGAAGESAAIDIDLKKVGAMPVEYTYGETPEVAPMAAPMSSPPSMSSPKSE